MHFALDSSMKYIFYFSMLSLSSCVIPTSSKIDYISPTNETSEKLAIIHIYRTSSFFGSGSDIDIYIDGKLAAELGNGDSMSVKVTFGIHKITTGGWQSDGRFPIIYYSETPGINHNFLPGETYYIRWKYPSFLQKGTWKLNPEITTPRFKFVDEKTYRDEK